MRNVDPKVEEAIDTLNMKDGPTRRKLLTGTGLVSATAAASALLAACSSSTTTGSTAKQTAGDFPSTPAWKFTFVNHVTTNPFFVPTQYGLADAAALLNIPKPAWTGSDKANIPDMVSATNSVASGAAMSQENTTINSYVLAHKSTLKGIFAVDAGSTQTVGQIIKKYSLQSKVASGGFDLTPQTLSAIQGGSLQFTIDQQPYLQGFLPVLALYLFNLSGGLVAPPETNTGLTFVTKQNVGPYLNTTSRYEGSSTQQKYIKRSGAIA